MESGRPALQNLPGRVSLQGGNRLPDTEQHQHRKGPFSSPQNRPSNAMAHSKNAHSGSTQANLDQQGVGVSEQNAQNGQNLQAAEPHGSTASSQKLGVEDPVQETEEVV